MRDRLDSGDGVIGDIDHVFSTHEAMTSSVSTGVMHTPAHSSVHASPSTSPSILSVEWSTVMVAAAGKPVVAINAMCLLSMMISVIARIYNEIVTGAMSHVRET